MTPLLIIVISYIIVDELGNMAKTRNEENEEKEKETVTYVADTCIQVYISTPDRTMKSNKSNKSNGSFLIDCAN
jgi:hypothetical protein